MLYATAQTPCMCMCYGKLASFMHVDLGCTQGPFVLASPSASPHEERDPCQYIIHGNWCLQVLCMV